MGRQLRVLIIVENLPVPFDRRVWSEATTLRDAGHSVYGDLPQGTAAISGRTRSSTASAIYRHPLPLEARGAAAYFVEYPIALFWEFLLSLKVWRRHGFDVIHACNPPDLIFLIGLFFKIFAGQELRLRPSRRQSGVLRGKIRPAWLLVEAVAARREAHLQGRGYLHRHKRVLSPHRHRARRNATRARFRGPLRSKSRSRQEPSRPILLGAGGRQFLVGYVGVISRSEGLDLLLSAIRHIVYARGRQDIHFVVAGSGPELEAIKQAWPRT